MGCPEPSGGIDTLGQTCDPPGEGSFATVGAAQLRLSALRRSVYGSSLLFVFLLVAWVFPLTLAILLAGLLWLQAALKCLACAFTAKPAVDRTTHNSVDKPVDEPVDWPPYTVLVPLHDEGEAVVARLSQNLAALDYPADKCQILYLCEADDRATCAAVEAHLSENMTLIRVPPGGPRTKPNALRVGMTQAVGDYVTIYDAEDAPHPGQLKAAITAFQSDPDLVALQAPLVVDNAQPSWVTRQFALEYAALFYVWVPWLCRAGMTVPLGGTSNHVRGLM